MEPRVVTVVAEMTVRELTQIFAEERIRGAPVVGPTGKVIGLVSEGDVLRSLVRDGEQTPDPDRLRVGEVMGPVGSAFAPSDDLPGVMERFVRDQMQRAVVLENGILLGIVTAADVIRGLA
jgi:predicted transcriptional regulator